MATSRSLLVIALGVHAVVAAQAPGVTAPGRLIDVGGRRMHLHCTGTGTPTVVLESSYGQFALDWSFVQPDVAKLTRVCSYDRAGLGWSDAGPNREHPGQIVADLHALLGTAREPSPYVLVSMGMGGFYTRAYALSYPDDAAGFVFIEPSHEDTFLMPVDGKPTPLWAVTPEQARGFVRSLQTSARPPPPPLVSNGPPFDRLPPELLKTRLVFEQRTLQLSGEADEAVEFESRRETAARLHAAGPALGARPVVVLTAERGPSGPFKDVQARIAALSQDSVQRIVPSGHFVHLEDPATVVRAIADVTGAVRTRVTLRK